MAEIYSKSFFYKEDMAKYRLMSVMKLLRKLMRLWRSGELRAKDKDVSFSSIDNVA
jgi:hypothetical protein